MKPFLPAVLFLALATPAARAQEPVHSDDTGARRDTVVPNPPRLAAAKTLAELLAARVPGLQVRPGSGAVASGSRLRLRGASGIQTPNDPLVVIDGVRVVSEPNDLLASEVRQQPSRLDDFVPDDVQRIEVLTGPAAIARYGPEGANGVVEVTTRRGTAGGPRFHGFAEAGARSDATEYPANFGRVGRLPGGARVTDCTLAQQSTGRCTPVADSLLSFNPLEEASPFRTGGTRRVGGSVEGGVGPLAFLAGGAAERDLGVLRRDGRERTEARGSFTLRPGGGVELAGSALHLRNLLELPSDVSIHGSLFNALTGNPFDDPERRGYASLTQAERDTLGVTQNVRRTVATASLRWSPLRWITVGGQYGVDDVASDEVPHVHLPPGSRRLGRTLETGRVRRNADTFARAEYEPLAGLHLATTLGAERTSALLHTLDVTGDEPLQSSSELVARRRTDALFARQGVAWRERVSASLFLRRDEPENGDPLLSGALSAAWELGREAFLPRPAWMDGLRLRAAYGRTEQGPGPGADFIPCGLNPCDRPELQRHTEGEAGVDASFHAGRLQLSLTGYDRRTDDVLALLPFPGGARLVNAGRVQNRGGEARVRVGSAPAAPFFWELVGTGSANRNRLEGTERPIVDDGSTGQISRAGHPLGSFYGPRITGFQDRNGDGIIGAAGCTGANQSACEVQLSSGSEFLGSPDPTRMLALQGRTRVRGVELSALLDHQGGAHRANPAERSRCRTLATVCRAAFDPSAPLADQARVIAYGSGRAFFPVDDATFTRLREAAVSVAVPQRWARRFGGRRAEFTVAGRNLATWTSYTGLDPETNFAAQAPFTFGDFFTQPLPRTLTTRFDVSF